MQINIRDAVDSIFLSADVQSIQRVESGTDVNVKAVLQNAQGEAGEWLDSHLRIGAR